MPRHYSYSATVPGNRERALDAAVELLGAEGLRALTHVRVDDRAGLPKGSTSNHFRTRAALLEGVVAHLGARDRPAVSAAAAPDSADALVADLEALYGRMTGPHRATTAAAAGAADRGRPRAGRSGPTWRAATRRWCRRSGRRSSGWARPTRTSRWRRWPRASRGCSCTTSPAPPHPDVRSVLALVVRAALVVPGGTGDGSP